MAIPETLTAWLEDFATALESWEHWLGEVEQAYLDGSYATLEALAAEGAKTQAVLAEAKRKRSELLQLGASQGLPASDVTHLARALRHALPNETFALLQQATRRLHRIQQVHTALWITGFHASNSVSAILEILATGSPDRATYGEVERSALEGGRIVDAAA